MTTTYLVENSHDAADCDDALDSLERAVRDNTLLCTCPDGAHSGTVIAEAEPAAEAGSFAGRWDVGETTVNHLTEMEVG